MRILISIFILTLTFCAKSQKYPLYENYKWEKTPQLIDRELEDPVYYYNQYDIIAEYIYDKVRGSYNKIETKHYRVFLNSDAAVEEFNKIVKRFGELNIPIQ